MNIKEFQEKINQRFPNENLKVIEYTKAKKYCKIQCLTCGKIYDFIRAENSYRKDKKHLCPNCANDKKLSNTYYKYLQLLENSNYIVIKKPINKLSTDPIELQCKKCGYIRKTTVDSFVNSTGKCPKCEIKNVKLTQEEVQQQIENITNHKIKMIGKYTNNVTSTLFKCNDCGFVWKAKPGNIKTGTRCPKCMRKESHGERAIKEWLIKHNIDFIQEYSIDCDGYREQRINFYIPKKNLAIEYNGIQHYEPIEHFGGEKEFLKTQERDERKKRFCSQNNIDLLIIKYTDYKNINKILSSTFND